MNLIERIDCAIYKIKELRWTSRVNHICKDKLVKLRVFDEDSPNGRMVDIYDGSSEGYKSDFSVNKGRIALSVLQSCEKVSRYDIFTKPIKISEDHNSKTYTRCENIENLTGMIV